MRGSTVSKYSTVDINDVLDKLFINSMSSSAAKIAYSDAITSKVEVKRTREISSKEKELKESRKKARMLM